MSKSSQRSKAKAVNKFLFYCLNDDLLIRLNHLNYFQSLENAIEKIKRKSKKKIKLYH